MTKLKPVLANGIPSYTFNQIEAVLNDQQYIRFQKWIVGQTVGDYHRKPVVYVHDYERFLAGLPPLD